MINHNKIIKLFFLNKYIFSFFFFMINYFISSCYIPLLSITDLVFLVLFKNIYNLRLFMIIVVIYLHKDTKNKKISDPEIKVTQNGKN